MLHLINDYYMDTDKYNYILLKRMIKQDGKLKGTEYFVQLGYYGKNLRLLKQAICKIYVFENITNKEMDRLINGLNEIIEMIEGIDLK